MERFKSSLLALFFLTIVQLLFFSNVLMSGKELISMGNFDIDREYFPSRHFAYSEIKKGNIPLWNPYLFSGTPFLSESQTGIFYPPNMIFLFLNTTEAINWSIVIHLILFGFFLYLWLRSHELSWLSALFASTIAMFSGPYFLHVLAGHLSNLYTLAWVPLILLSLEKLSRKGLSLGAVLLGTCAVSMHILGGHYQYVYYTGILVMLYLPYLWARSPCRFKFFLSTGIVYLFSFALSSVQVLISLFSKGESNRESGLTFDNARVFSLPFENIMTFLSPGIMGDDVGLNYWGLWMHQEVCLFFGITGLVLAVHGFFQSKIREKWVFVFLMLAMFCLSFGENIPFFYRLLYENFPGYNLFRGTSKFSFLAVLFLLYFSAQGFFALSKRPFNLNWSLGFLVFSILILLIGFWIEKDAVKRDGFLVSWLRPYQSTVHSSLSRLFTLDAPIQIAHQAKQKLMICSITFFILGLISLLHRFVIRDRGCFLYFIFALIEMIVFAFPHRATHDYNDYLNMIPWNELKETGPEFRHYYAHGSNKNMVYKLPTIAGTAPWILKRYWELMSVMEGENWQFKTPHIQFYQFPPPLIRMFRVKEFTLNDDIYNPLGRIRISDPLDRFHIVPNWTIETERRQIFRKLFSPEFDPKKLVVLEKDPGIARTAEDQKQLNAIDSSIDLNSAKKTISYTDISTDETHVEVTVQSPAILIMTDSYAKDWIAVPLPGSSQTSYDLMPANYAIRGIPLMAGKHRIKIEYRPKVFIIGIWVSGLSLLLLVVLCPSFFKLERYRSLIKPPHILPAKTGDFFDSGYQS